MSHERVQFEEQKYHVSNHTRLDSTLISFLIRKDIAKNKQQAIYILLGIIIVAVILTFFVLRSSKPHFTPVHQEQPPPGWTP